MKYGHAVFSRCWTVVVEADADGEPFCTTSGAYTGQGTSPLLTQPHAALLVRDGPRRNWHTDAQTSSPGATPQVGSVPQNVQRHREADTRSGT